jgi:hypothetical protein
MGIWIAFLAVIVDWPVALAGLVFYVFSKWMFYVQAVDLMEFLNISSAYYDAVFGFTLGFIIVFRALFGRSGGWNS